jgi:hypothetical protein
MPWASVEVGPALPMRIEPMDADLSNTRIGSAKIVVLSRIAPASTDPDGTVVPDLGLAIAHVRTYNGHDICADGGRGLVQRDYMQSAPPRLCSEVTSLTRPALESET